MTGKEINRLVGAVRFMLLHCSRRNRLFWATTDRGTERKVISDVQRRITKLQGVNDLPRFNATVFESCGGTHAHIIFIGNADLVQRLQGSAAFGECIKVEPVTDPEGLTHKYLAKERTPQAGYARGHKLGGRIRGSHPLEGGGDRVRLSDDLKRDAVEAAYVNLWIPENAKRKADRKANRPRRIFPKKAPRPAGQILLFPEQKPVARLQAFGRGLIPPAVAAEIEFRRRQRGLSQRQLGAILGISQSHYANALRGHDPISAAVVNRLRRALLTV